MVDRAPLRPAVGREADLALGPGEPAGPAVGQGVEADLLELVGQLAGVAVDRAPARRSGSACRRCWARRPSGRARCGCATRPTASRSRASPPSARAARRPRSTIASGTPRLSTETSTTGPLLVRADRQRLGPDAAGRRRPTPSSGGQVAVQPDGIVRRDVHPGEPELHLLPPGRRRDNRRADDG